MSSKSRGLVKRKAVKKHVNFKKNPLNDGGVGKRRRKAHLDEEIESGSEIESDEAEKEKTTVSSDEELEETAQDKKLRTAKFYLQQLKDEEARKQELDEVTHDAISHRLRQDDLEKAGKLHKTIADQYTCPDPAAFIILRGHQLPVTCAVVTSDSKVVFSASKDGTIIKWCVESRKKIHVIPGGRKGTESTHIGHTVSVLSLALTTDSKFLASGDANNVIHIWDPSSCQRLHTFTGHRKAVTGLVFRKNTHQLFSASFDHVVKIWDLDEMAYVETLYGHEEGIVAIDSLIKDRAITVGRDHLVHIFKVPEESAMRFAKHFQVDSVAFINESAFITGGDDNCLSLWNVMKKKPVYLVKKAHSGKKGQGEGGQEGQEQEGQGQTALGEHWISAVASLPFTDLVASGSSDGFLRLWKCQDLRSLKPLFSLPVSGFINSLQFSSKGDLLVAGIGQEHRLGRWWRNKQAKNAVLVIPLVKSSSS